MSTPTRTKAAIGTIKRFPLTAVFDPLDSNPVFEIREANGVSEGVVLNLTALLDADGKLNVANFVAALSIVTASINDLAVTVGKLGAGAVTKAKAAVFVSAEQTGTGAGQKVAHGLAAVPVAVLIVPTDTAPATIGVYTAVEGAHDATNVVVTVTSGKKFKVFAWA